MTQPSVYIKLGGQYLMKSRKLTDKRKDAETWPSLQLAESWCRMMNQTYKWKSFDEEHYRAVIE